MEYNEWLERILAQESPGGEVERLSVVVPSVVQPGEPFVAKLCALDDKGYPSLECEGVVRLTDEVAEGPREAAAFEQGKPAVGRIEGVALPEEGLFRVETEFEGEQYYSNPVQCTNETRDRLFWGDPHVHTVLSNCSPDRCRSLSFCFVAARYLTGLDWVCATDHVSNGRGDLGKWQAQRVAARLFNDPPKFVTLLGYEASLKGGGGGDNNVYFRDDADEYVDEYEEGDIRTLSEGLRGTNHFIVPHHTTRTGKHGELSDWLYVGPEEMPVVEIYSKWGTSEYRGNPIPLDEVHPGPSYVQDFLARGYALGFIGGTDSHATMPSAWGEESSHIAKAPAFTAVRARQLKRSDIWDNIRSRNCYATRGERILLLGNIAGVGLGTRCEWKDPQVPRRVVATIAAESDIVKVDVVCNGKEVYSQAGSGWHLSLDWTDEEPLTDMAFEPCGAFEQPFVYYYLRVTCTSQAQAWSSPVWLTL